MSTSVGPPVWGCPHCVSASRESMVVNDLLKSTPHYKVPRRGRSLVIKRTHVNISNIVKATTGSETKKTMPQSPELVSFIRSKPAVSSTKEIQGKAKNKTYATTEKD